MSKLIVVFILTASVFSPAFVSAAGLSTGFSEVTIENLQAGNEYSTSQTIGLPLAVVNTGEEAVDLKMELIMPQAHELKSGYEPIPDISWIRLEKAEFKGIKPKDSAVTDVFISVPKDALYKGKRYQVFIWTHTIGRAIGVGLKSKLLFTVTEGQTTK